MKRSYLLLIIPVLFFAPFLLSQRTPEARAAQRVLEQYRAADRLIQRPGTGVADIQKFAEDLRQIDTSGTPANVKHAMSQMILTVEKSLQVHQSQGDTNAANNAVAEAKKALLRSLDKSRGHSI